MQDEEETPALQSPPVQKVDNEIPSEFVEYPPPESLSNLDKQLDGILEDIKAYIDSREKEFINASEGNHSMRYPVVNVPPSFFHFKDERKEYIQSLMEVEMPEHQPTSSELLMKQLKDMHLVDKEITSESLAPVLESFYKDRAERILFENTLLMSRWGRFCKSSFDAQKFSSVFKRYQHYLRQEYSNAVDRYERLHVFHVQSAASEREQKAAQEKKQIQDELRGLAVVNQRKKKKENKKLEDIMDQAKEKREDESVFGTPLEVNDKVPYSLTDLVLYIRQCMIQNREKKDMSIYMARAKQAIYNDREEIIKDYKFLDGLKPGDDLSDRFEYYCDLNGYIDQVPLRPSKLEDFLVEFDILANRWKLETVINQEDGRPFAYEVEHKFFSNFTEQSLEATLLPYDPVTFNNDENADISSQTHTLGGFRGNTGLDSMIISLASITGASAKIVQKSRFPRLRYSDWLGLKTVVPDPEEAQSNYKASLDELKVVDMELRLEHDLLLSSDHEHVTARLKESAKVFWERAAQVQYCRPVNTKITLIPQTHEYKHTESNEPRHHKIFDFGLKIPDGKEDVETNQILDSKKQAYGSILKSNAECKKIEQEILSADPTRVFDPANYIVPTVASVFAEHEVFAYLQLRYISLREARIKLVGQFNFFRSVEKRVILDMHKRHSQSMMNGQAEMREAVAEMWRKMEVFDLSNVLGKGHGDATKYTIETSNEDIRSIVNDRIYVTDKKGVNFIYDTAISDMEQFEQESLKILTLYINGGHDTDETPSSVYIDELRPKMPKVRTELANVTFLNPLADRAQLLLEYYEAHVEYQYAKVELINNYLEAFEHVTDPEKSLELIQIIIGILQSRPILDLTQPYFSKSYLIATRSLKLQAAVAEEFLQHTIKQQRLWMNRYGINIKDQDDTQNSAQTVYSSSFELGLPHYIADQNMQTVVMHQPGMILGMTEIVPSMDNIVYIHQTHRQFCQDASREIKELKEGQSVSQVIVELTAIKVMKRIWDCMSDHGFQPHRSTKQSNGLLNDQLLENPYLPDVILSEYYVPFDLSDENNFKSLGVALEPSNFFTDESYKLKALDLMLRFLRFFVLKRRLRQTWIETENWRKTFDYLFDVMGIKNKSAFCGRLGPLNFDAPKVGGEEATAEDEVDEENQDQHQQSMESSLDIAALKDRAILKFGPLAISEVEEPLATIELGTVQEILKYVRPRGFEQLQQATRVQMLDRTLYMSAVEMHTVVMEEIYQHQLNDFVHLVQKEDNHLPFGVDFKQLTTNILAKKKLLRKSMISEYSKTYRTFKQQDLSEQDFEEHMHRFKTKLLDWYCQNLLEITSLECERAEFARVIQDLRRHFHRVPYGKLIFSPSHIQKTQDYFAKEKENTQQSVGYKQTVPVQEMYAYEQGSTAGEKLAKIWYLPHTTEIMLSMTQADKQYKQSPTVDQLMFKNNQVYLKSSKIYCMIYEIYFLVILYSRLLQDNGRFNTTVRELREADYIVNTMTQLKRELLAQGTTTDYTRVEAFFLSRWNHWFLKWKYTISMACHVLEPLILPEDVKILQFYYRRFINPRFKKLDGRPDPFSMLFVNSKTIKITQNVIYQWKVFGSLSHEAKQLCDSKVAECEEIMEEYIQGIQFTGSEDEKNRKITDFLINRLRLLTFRREYMKVLMGEDLPFKTEDHVKAFFEKYRMRILVPAIRQYHKLGSKGNATTTNLLVMTLAERAEINGTARTSFERCEREALQNEIQRNMTLRRILRARELLGMLSDERVGKLFREAGSVTVPSPADQPEFSFRITEEDYGTRSSIFNHFLADLFSSNNALIQELRSIEVAAIAKSNAKGNQKAAVDEATMRLNIIDDKRIYACKKEDLAKAVLQMAAQLNKWKQDRTMEQQKFMGALDTHLFETIRNCEKIILQQSQEKREQQASYKRDVRMLGSELAVDAFAEMASMEVELNELRKSRKVEERRIRNKIIDEYDSLVQELVREIAVVNGRFHEYQISNFNDIMNIMAESQKEQLGIMAANVDLPDSMREVANSIMEHQTQLEEYRQQNHDLKLTVLKIRSMFLMKEQALKAFFDSKLRKLQEDNKESQEKLWDSYRDAEARERTLRKQLAKMQKQKSSLEVQNETLQRQLREEQLKATQKVTGKSDRSQSAKSARTKSAEVEHKPKQTGVNVDHLLQELANKTALVEELLQEKRDRNKPTRGLLRKETRMLRKTPQVFRDETINFLSPAAESDSFSRSNLQGNEMARLHELVGQLSSENKALRRKLFLNGIQLPEESKRSSSASTSRLLVSAGSQGDTLFSLSGLSSPSRSRPRTAAQDTMEFRRMSLGKVLLPDLQLPKDSSLKPPEIVEEQEPDDDKLRPKTAPSNLRRVSFAG